MENGDIADENVAASTQFSDRFFPGLARLNRESTWAAAESDLQPWIQADIGYQTNVSGVVTQGEGNIGESIIDWVTSLKVSTFYMTPNDKEIFVKNVNEEVKVKIL